MTNNPSSRPKGHRWEVVVETFRFSISDLLKFTVVVALAITVGRLIQSFIPTYSANIFFCLVCSYFIYWHLIKRFVFSRFRVSRRYAGSSLGIGSLVGSPHARKGNSRIALLAVGAIFILLSLLVVPLNSSVKLPSLTMLSNSALMLFMSAYRTACLELKGITPEDIEFLENGVCIGFLFFPWVEVDVKSSDWVQSGVVIQKRVKPEKAKPNPFVAKVSPELLDEVLRIANQSQVQSVVVE